MDDNLLHHKYSHENAPGNVLANASNALERKAKSEVHLVNLPEASA